MDVMRGAQDSPLALLRSLRDAIAAAIDDGVAPRDLASLSRRLMEIVREIDALERASSDEDPIHAAATTPDEAWPAH